MAQSNCKNIYKKSNRYDVRSAGLSASARIRLNEKLLLWADVIFVMEKEHRNKLYTTFGNLLNEKQVVVLHIPDEYAYMHPELVAMIRAGVDAHFDT